MLQRHLDPNHSVVSRLLCICYVEKKKRTLFLFSFHANQLQVDMLGPQHDCVVNFFHVFRANKLEIDTPGPWRDRVVYDSVLHGTVLITNFSVVQTHISSIPQNIWKLYSSHTKYDVHKFSSTKIKYNQIFFKCTVSSECY